MIERHRVAMATLPGLQWEPFVEPSRLKVRYTFTDEFLARIHAEAVRWVERISYEKSLTPSFMRSAPIY